MKHSALLVALCLLIVPSVAAAQQPVKLSRPELMKQKLASSQKLLEALALEDYDAIVQDSQRLSLLSSRYKVMFNVMTQALSASLSNTSRTISSETPRLRTT